MELTLLQPKAYTIKKQIRPFNEVTDLIPLRKLIHRAVEVCYPAYYEDEAIRYYMEYHKNAHILMRARSGLTLVCLANNRIAGTGSLINNTVHSIFTDPALQGKGIGKRVMHALVQEAQQQGISRLSLEATPGSRKFYEMFGFKKVREKIIDIDTIHILNYFVMEKFMM